MSDARDLVAALAAARLARRPRRCSTIPPGVTSARLALAVLALLAVASPVAAEPKVEIDGLACEKADADFQDASDAITNGLPVSAFLLDQAHALTFMAAVTEAGSAPAVPAEDLIVVKTAKVGAILAAFYAGDPDVMIRLYDTKRCFFAAGKLTGAAWNEALKSLGWSG